MTRRHRTPRSLVRELRPSAFGFAAVAALYDPTPLLQLRTAQLQRERPNVPPAR